MEEVNSKIIREKLLSVFGVALIIGFVPFSFGWFFLGLAVGVFAVWIGVQANYQRSKELTLLHHIGIVGVFAIMGLRYIDLSASLTWKTLFWFFLSIVAASVLPFANKRISSFLYREQTAPETKLGRMLFWFSFSLAPLIGVLGASLGQFASRSGMTNPALAFSGYIMIFLLTPAGVFFNVHRYVSGKFVWRTKGKKKS